MVALMLSCCADIYYLHGPTTGDYSQQILWERVVATAMMIITVIVIVLERWVTARHPFLTHINIFIFPNHTNTLILYLVVVVMVVMAA